MGENRVVKARGVGTRRKGRWSNDGIDGFTGVRWEGVPRGRRGI